jgi:membrane carboxypeptidase/penicillin-binding protein
MTDVQGEPQQGGALPAVIWKTYMSAVTEGQPCVEFQPSKEAISYRPFYGKHTVTGEALLAPSAPSGHHGKHGHQPGASTPNGHGEHAVIEVQEEPPPKEQAPPTSQPQTPAPSSGEPATPPTPASPTTGGAAPP